MTFIQKAKLLGFVAILIIGGLLFLFVGKTLSIIQSAGVLLIYLAVAFALAFLLMLGWKKLKGG